MPFSRRVARVIRKVTWAFFQTRTSVSVRTRSRDTWVRFHDSISLGDCLNWSYVCTLCRTRRRTYLRIYLVQLYLRHRAFSDKIELRILDLSFWQTTEKSCYGRNQLSIKKKKSTVSRTENLKNSTCCCLIFSVSHVEYHIYLSWKSSSRMIIGYP